MKTTELRAKSADELNAELLRQLEVQFRLRMRRASGQLSQTHEMALSRRTIARIKTLLREQSGDRDG